MFGIARLVELLEPAELDHPARAGRTQSVRTMMSRPIDWPCESGPWIFPKNESLSLMSST